MAMLHPKMDRGLFFFCKFFLASLVLKKITKSLLLLIYYKMSYFQETKSCLEMPKKFVFSIYYWFSAEKLLGIICLKNLLKFTIKWQQFVNFTMELNYFGNSILNFHYSWIIRTSNSWKVWNEVFDFFNSIDIIRMLLPKIISSR